MLKVNESHILVSQPLAENTLEMFVEERRASSAGKAENLIMNFTLSQLEQLRTSRECFGGRGIAKLVF